MLQILIGKEGNQPFPISDDYVSRQHCVFVYDDTTGRMTLTDKSTNGTFIHMGNAYQQVKQCYVDMSTIVRLGPRFVFSISQLFQKDQKPRQTSKPKPQRENIAYLRTVSEQYEETKLKLDQKQANINSLRSLSLTATIAGGAVSTVIPNLFGVDGTMAKLIGPCIAVVLLVALSVYCSRAGKAVIRERSRNEKDYKMRFCCPKCHTSFANKLYENILAEGKCPKCRTEFFDTTV